VRPGGSVPPSSELHIGVWTGRKVTTFPKAVDKNESAEQDEPSTMRIQRQHDTSPTKKDHVLPRPFREARSILAQNLCRSTNDSGELDRRDFR